MYPFHRSCNRMDETTPSHSVRSVDTYGDEWITEKRLFFTYIDRRSLSDNLYCHEGIERGLIQAHTAVYRGDRKHVHITGFQCQDQRSSVIRTDIRIDNDLSHPILLVLKQSVSKEICRARKSRPASVIYSVLFSFLFRQCL